MNIFRKLQETLVSCRFSTNGLKRRYWNDELEPCIVKYCLKYQYDRFKYMKCVQRFCPSGLVTVPREIENEDYPSTSLVSGEPQSPTLDEVVRVCATLQCQAISSQLQEVLCRSAKCDLVLSGQVEEEAEEESTRPESLSSLMPELPSTAAGSTPRLRLLHYSLLNMCGELNCPDLHGADYLNCMALHCSGGTGEGEERAGGSDSGGAAGKLAAGAGDVSRGDASSEPALMRKRRVNAVNAQCIQSQCGSKTGPARKICMINFCHGR